MYYRLIKESETEIHISTEGLEIPGAECVRIDPATSGYISPNLSYWRNYIIAFENGNTIRVGIASINSPASVSIQFTKITEFIFTKCTTDS